MQKVRDTDGETIKNGRSGGRRMKIVRGERKEEWNNKSGRGEG